jgi:hypothetical protein
MNEGDCHVETRPSSKQTAVRTERATAAVGGPWKAVRISGPGGVPLGSLWTVSCAKDRAMNRAWLEERIRVRFGSQEAALVAALHEVQVCVESPVYYTAVLQMYPGETPNGAILRLATARGKQWLSS